jgi:hypothetical protein
MDLPSYLVSKGHKFYIAGHKRADIPHKHVYDSPGILFPKRIAPLIDNKVRHSDSLSESEIQSFFDFYKDDPELASVDAFVCSFPASFCEAYMPFNKTIIFYPGHRFFMGRCSRAEADALLQHVRMIAEQTSPRSFVVASSIYDALYLKYFTGLDVPVITINAFWYARNRTSPTVPREEVLVVPLQRGSNPFALEMAFAAERAGANILFATAHELYGNFTLDEIASHPAAVILPYAVYSFGITELFALELPLFVPDPAFLAELGTMDDVRITQPQYCGARLAPVPPPHPKAAAAGLARHSPESGAAADAGFWLQFADFYQSPPYPPVETFSSWDDLVRRLAAADLPAARARARRANDAREADVERAAGRVLAGVERGRAVPREYGAALREVWGVERLQAT